MSSPARMPATRPVTASSRPQAPRLDLSPTPTAASFRLLSSLAETKNRRLPEALVSRSQTKENVRQESGERTRHLSDPKEYPPTRTLSKRPDTPLVDQADSFSRLLANVLFGLAAGY